MKKLLFFTLLSLSGCKSADVNRLLNDAAKVATGPCAQAVAGAAAACKADPVVGPILPAPQKKP
jgi:hypothetical protein